MVDREELLFNEFVIEPLAEEVHKAYCSYCKEVKGEEYWTKGDYSLLDDKTKEIDRYTVRAILNSLEKLVTELKSNKLFQDAIKLKKDNKLLREEVESLKIKLKEKI